MNNNNYKQITTAATTTFYGSEVNRVILRGIAINQPLTGTLIIKSDTTAIGTIAASTAAGMYWHSEQGIEIEKLTIVNGSSENVTVFYATI
jgi:hypothetical protein